MGTLEDIYTREWFENDFKDLRPEFEIVAEAIGREFESYAGSALDIGCGPAMLLAHLLDRFDWTVGGVEGSSHGIEMAHALFPHLEGCILHRDITELAPDNIDKPYGVIICTEVAEHLEERHAPHLVRLVASFHSPVVWTAAPPGQAGHHHVNCKPFEYWRDLFANHGMRLDAEKTSNLQARWRNLSRLSHMRNNAAVWV